MLEHFDRARRSRRTRLVAFVLAVVMLLVPLSAGGPAGAGSASGTRPDQGGPEPTIVLVHGDWADGSSWNAVTQRLQRRGYDVVAPPNPLRGPTSDAAYLASYLETIPGPIVLVGHSYGGFVTTNAATGDPDVKALVYIDAFIPDAGETAGELAVGSCVDPATAVDAVPVPGGAVDLYLRHDAAPPYPGYAACFANGVDRRDSAVLFASQRPAALEQFSDPSGPPAWETIPSWSLIGTADRVIPPAQQEAMSARAGAQVTTVNAGHLSLVTRPHAVTEMIEAAADATT